MSPPPSRLELPRARGDGPQETAPERPYGSAARLVVYLRDHRLTYQELGLRMKPAVTKGAVSAWTRQVAIPSVDYRRQLDELTRGFVPQGGWAPTVRDLTEACEVLMRADLVLVEVAPVAAEAARVVARAERVRGEVRPVPKATRQRWTRWLQQRLPL